jgi:small subunit ribosomal protein S8e
MTQWHMKSRRKETGGVRHSLKRCDKKKAWLGGEPVLTKLSEEREVKVKNGRGNTFKVKLVSDNKVCVSDQKSGNTFVGKAVSVLENAANRHFVRRNIITRGAKLLVEHKNKQYVVLVTSRPSQTGVIQAVLLEEQLPASKKKAKVASAANTK